MSKDENYTCNRPDIIEKLDDLDWFINFFRAQFRLAFLPIKKTAIINDGRLINAYDFWRDDLKRVSDREMHGNDLDEFKTFGHLCYWIRRTSPQISVNDRNTPPQYGEEYLEGDKAEDYKKFLYQYSNEYVAFDTCFRACRYLHLMSSRPDEEIQNYNLSKNFYKSVCHMQKTKNVSPHALYLILLALFQRQERKLGS